MGLVRSIGAMLGAIALLGHGEAAAVTSFCKNAYSWVLHEERGIDCTIFDSDDRVRSTLSMPISAV